MGGEGRLTADGDFFACLDGFGGTDADLVGFGHETSVCADRVRAFELRERGRVDVLWLAGMVDSLFADVSS